MAQSRFTTRQYASPNFVESCGAMLFDISDASAPKVCLLQYLPSNEWLLAKGRRNHGESRSTAALRETTEETGYSARLFPVTMNTRAPSCDDACDAPDKVRIVQDCEEPFMFTLRELGDGKGVKIIWWYIAVLDEGSISAPEIDFRPEFFDCNEAVNKLHYKTDQEVLAEAIILLKANTRKGSL